jgi:hypothetical protein
MLITFNQEIVMSMSAPKDLERVVRASRRQLALALVLIVIYGGASLVMLTVPDSGAAQLARKLWTMLPVVVSIVAAGSLYLSSRGASMKPSNPALKAIRNDELRQASQHRAYRNGFFVLLVAQPVMAVLLATYPVHSPLAVMAAAGALLGATAFLASLLYYDR